MVLLSSPSLWAGYIAVSFFPMVLCIIIYRRYLHPLAKVPGPFLWSISGLPILYYQGIKEGNLVYELPRLHDIYGNKYEPSQASSRLQQLMTILSQDLYSVSGRMRF